MRNSRSDYPILNLAISKDDNNFKICVGARPQRATIAKEASCSSYQNKILIHKEYIKSK